MLFKNMCVLIVLWTKVASALEVLTIVTLAFGSHDLDVIIDHAYVILIKCKELSIAL